MRHFSLIFLALFPLWATSTAHRKAPVRPGGTDYALFFAVETYDDPKTWKTLPGLVKECEDIRKDLVERYGFSPESKVVRNPSLSEIYAELARWRSKTYGSDDQLLVFFSGHGQFLDDLGEGFFIPRDGTSKQAAEAERKWYSLLQIPRHVNNIGCRHILLAIDACYSGTIDSRVALKNEDEEWEKPTQNPDAEFNKYVHDRLAGKSRILLTSGGKTRTKHPSDFVRWFREALATLGGKDRLLMPHDIEEQWPPEKTSDRPLAGTFEGHEPGGTFLFVYQSKAPAPPPDGDYDDDGVPDIQDKCPSERGPASTKGCPDRDGDGVADKFDLCPGEKGPLDNNGCPRTDDGMVFVRGGTFSMGSNDYDNEKPIHSVMVPDFYMGKHEVTVQEYLKFADETGANYSEWLEKGNKYHVETGTESYYKDKGYSRSTAKLPIVGISWNDAKAYCEWLSKKTGRNYRLPTEAEWEYAARGGSQSKGYTYAGSNNLDEVAWYSTNSSSKPQPVGGKKANELGIYDLSGNVWEWCAELVRRLYYSPPNKPKGR